MDRTLFSGLVLEPVPNAALVKFTQALQTGKHIPLLVLLQTDTALGSNADAVLLRRGELQHTRRIDGGRGLWCAAGSTNLEAVDALSDMGLAALQRVILANVGEVAAADRTPVLIDRRRVVPFDWASSAWDKWWEFRRRVAGQVVVRVANAVARLAA